MCVRIGGLYGDEGSQVHTVLGLLQEQNSAESEGDTHQKAQGSSQAWWRHMCALQSFGIWCTFESGDFGFFFLSASKRKSVTHI